MTLSAGTKLGTYEIQSVLGAGGMGEVYRARDTKLGRSVAIKVLPEAVASDPERTARFEREAKVLASLNHPHIAAVFGMEESDGRHFLIMELVEGPTLADRVAHGPIPVDEALSIARQIAEALEAAHEKAIIHRDLKPANIKVRDDGTVKVLDFGLAKAMEPASMAGMDATASPTITSPAMMTGVGMLLGTAACMSPEQAKGRVADKRSDVWGTWHAPRPVCDRRPPWRWRHGRSLQSARHAAEARGRSQDPPRVLSRAGTRRARIGASGDRRGFSLGHTVPRARAGVTRRRSTMSWSMHHVLLQPLRTTDRGRHLCWRCCGAKPCGGQADPVA